MKKMHIKLAFFAVFSALSSLGKSAVLLGKVLFSGIMEISETGGKSSGRQF